MLFYKNYIVYQIVYICMIRVRDLSYFIQSFVVLRPLVSEIAKCIAWGCLLLFYKNYIVYYKVYCYSSGVVIETYICVYQVSS